jgi:uncharacterized membrane protein/predicted DsbA family dithiol-disulfide isomerase
MSPGSFRAALAVAFATAAVAVFLRYETARHEATGAASSCSLSATLDCDAVQTSAYAKVLGFPLSMWGALGALVLGSCLLASRRDPRLLVATGAAALFAAAVVVYTAVVSWVVLGKICLYCSAMQAGFLVFAILVAPAAWRARADAPGPRRPLLFGGTVAAFLLALAISGDVYAAERSRLARLFGPTPGKGLRLDIADTLLLGDPTTPVSVVLFFDLGCPRCEERHRDAVALVKQYPRCVHFRFKHYPLDRSCNAKLPKTEHQGACDAAVAAQAAQALRLDAKALELIFAHQLDGFSRIVLDAIGDELGVPRAKWDELRASPAIRALVERDVAEGNALELPYVPIAYVNGRPVDAQRLPEAVGRRCR